MWASGTWPSTSGGTWNILGLDIFPVGIGFWAQMVCVGVAMTGATLLLMTAPVEDDGSQASPVQPPHASRDRHSRRAHT